MNSAVTVEITYTPEDFARAYEHMRKKNKRRYYGFFLLLALLTINLLIDLLRDPAAGLRNALTPRFGVVTAIFLLAWGGFVWLRSRRYSWYIKRAYERYISRSPIDQGPGRYTISEEGVTGERTLISGTTKWQAYSKVEESPDFLFFYTHPQSSTFVPKRAFNTDDLMNVRQLITGHVSNECVLELMP